MMPFGWLESVASDIAAPLWEAMRTVVSSPLNRRVSSREHRTHLEARGIHAPRNARAAQALEHRLTELDGVHHAEVNAVLGRVVVDHDPDVASASDLTRVVADVEREHGLERADTAPGSVHHPGNSGPLVREAGALGLTVLGLGYSAATALIPVRVLPPVVPAVLSLTDNVPWMRNAVESRLGRPWTDMVFAIGGALSLGLAQRPLALATDTCQRWCTSRETMARYLAWQRWEEEALHQPGSHRAEALDVPTRPIPLRDGSVERVANTSGSLALAGYGAMFALTRSPQRAMALLSAGIPRAANAGRLAFVAQLTSAMSDRGSIVLNPMAMRRLDRIDTIVLDAPVLTSGRRVVDTVVPWDPGADPAPLFKRAAKLVDPRRPKSRHERGEWTAVPLGDFDGELPEHVKDAARSEADRGASLLVVSHQSEPAALASVISELDPLAEALVEAASAEAEVVVAGVGSRLDRRLPIAQTVVGGTRLVESVGRLQSEGRVVAVVSARARSALAAADLGIGLRTPDHALPWGAHVVCTNISEVHTLLGAIEHARSTSQYSAALAAAGSCLGAVFTVLGPATSASARASLPVNSAALFALGLGTWAGTQATDRAPPAARIRTPWHAMPRRAVLRLLSSSTGGLSDSEARRRQPPGEREVGSGEGVARSTLEGLINPMTPLLVVGAVLSAGLGSVLDAVMIIFVLVASALVEAVQKVTARRELVQLLDAGQLPAHLRRDGETRTVPADQLVPGDVVELHAGDGVPADCRVLRATGVEVDESSLTGESQLVTKTTKATTATTIADRTSMLYQGTMVATGNATAVVVATGSRTEIGRTTQENGAPAKETSGVDKKLSAWSKSTLPLSAGAGAALLFVDVLRGSPIGQALSRAVGLTVAAVPEGLPFVATVAELAAARRLSQRGVLVRSPATVEALGRVDALCFDKTGTLTQGRISLRQVSDGTFGRAPEELDPWLGQVVEAAVRATPRPEGGRPLAHPTDQAVLDGAQRAGYPPDGSKLVAELPFEPSRGYHAVRASLDDRHQISVKGAPEVVLERCTRRARPEGLVGFDPSVRAEVVDEVERLALQGFRVLAVAERTTEPAPGLDDEDVSDLVFVGLLALADPVHPTAAEAVGHLQRAGVDVMMITGDHPSTAEAIAAELDMLNGRRVVHGAELDELEDDELTAEIPKIAVFARVSPAQKARIVRVLRRADRVVAMTGDGANDVPAIRLAHVGIALGSRATPAAREAADLVIADDRIETITEAIVEGRGMWASVHDSLSILLGGNLGEIGYTLGAGLFGGGGALNARQLLVVNLLTDILPALAIAVRPPPGATPEKLLAEGPESSLGAALTRDVYTRATATAAAAGVALVLTRPFGTMGQARTAGLVAVVAGQLGQTLALRGRTPLVLIAGAGSLLVLAAVVQVPGLSQFFGNQPLLTHHWVIALGSAAAATVAVALWQAWATGVSEDTAPA
jgi:cation-transporting ATPase I